MEVTRNPENGKFRLATITDVEYAQIAEDGGICLSCDNVQTPVEPDARRVTCESCGKSFVYGVGDLLIMGRIKITAEARNIALRAFGDYFGYPQSWILGNGVPSNGKIRPNHD